jgi:hypothetical protein
LLLYALLLGLLPVRLVDALLHGLPFLALLRSRMRRGGACRPTVLGRFRWLLPALLLGPVLVLGLALLLVGPLGIVSALLPLTVIGRGLLLLLGGVRKLGLGPEVQPLALQHPFYLHKVFLIEGIYLIHILFGAPDNVRKVIKPAVCELLDDLLAEARFGNGLGEYCRVVRGYIIVVLSVIFVLFAHFCPFSRTAVTKTAVRVVINY